MTTEQSDDNSPSPSEFMRGRKPDMFPDTPASPVLTVDRAQLDYHLETLTNRKQEVEFEEFCRRLIQKEVCPNLSPQTGPTGGGDSKVDAETFPVSDKLSIRWADGIAREAASERWAFAFSCKKTWRPKIRKDVAGIISTKRAYARIFFVTNQYVRDKDRAAVEDELTATHGIPVTIFDRNWLCSKLIEGHHYQIAIDTLKVSPVLVAPSAVGPKDAQNQTELAELIEAIDSSGRQESYSLVQDLLAAAELARCLGRSKSEAIGFLAQARETADRLGAPELVAKSIFERIWTLFWWHDDRKAPAGYYAELETVVLGSCEARDLSLLSSVWILYFGTLDADVADPEFKARTARLLQKLSLLESDRERPNNAAFATLLRVEVSLLLQLRTAEPVSAVLADLKALIGNLDTVISFPFDQLEKFVFEFLPNVEAQIPAESIPLVREIENLVCSFKAKLEGEAAEGLLRHSLAQKRLKAKDPVGCLEQLGLARTRLRGIYLPVLIDVLRMAELCYEQLGLFWAARTENLTALALTWQERERGNPWESISSIVHRQVWLELRLARLPHVLFFLSFLNGLLEQSEPDEEEVRDWCFLDLAVAKVILSLPDELVRHLEGLPTFLNRCNATIASAAVFYRLGYPEKIQLPEALVFDETPARFFERLPNQLHAADLPGSVFVNNNEGLKTYILGAEVEVNCNEEQPSLLVAESILSSIETAFARVSLGTAVAFVPHVLFKVKASQSVSICVDTADSHIEVHYCAGADAQSPLGDVRKFVANLLVGFAQGAKIAPSESLLDLVNSQSALANIGAFQGLANAYQVGYGSAYPPRIENLLDASDERYPVISIPPAAAIVASPGRKSSARHRDIRRSRLIDELLWDRAQWGAILYLYCPGPPYAEPPIMALGFHNAQAGREIFQSWRKNLGCRDDKELIRVTLVRGLKEPTNYAVLIGENLDVSGSHFSTNRVHLMTPPNTQNLDGFLANYGVTGEFLLGCADLSNLRKPPDLTLCLAKRQLNTRRLEEIAEDEIDAAVLRTLREHPLAQG